MTRDYPIATRPASADLSPPISWGRAESEFPEASAYFDLQNPLRGRDPILRIAKREWVSYALRFGDESKHVTSYYLLAIPIDTDPVLHVIPGSGPEARAFEGAAAWHARYCVWVTYSEWSPLVVWPESNRQFDARATRVEDTFFGRQLERMDARADNERLASIGDVTSTFDMNRVAAERVACAHADALALRRGTLSAEEIIKLRFGTYMRYFAGVSREDYTAAVAARAISVRVVDADGTIREVEDR